ncbi:hypothetical protein BDV25DRAFT_162888 [Aspergillus avenaceus]|uniref:Peroxin 20 n=1 Tax=Aspergillus avenaceus TaxID=36643 RepID=A0A5N6TJ25_ASPAV|nr:hypothetical protein BDV25DRAFT_162888 [Aspergillus avenaceus]
MSDALCGPSNALQNLHKHASVDRTLQQDRLTSRQSPSRGFRLQTHNEGILDPEFAAFESNVAETPIPSLQHQTHLAAPSSHFSVHNQSENQQWSADFQRLQISASPLQMRQQPSLAAGPTSTVAQHGWHSEFIKQQQQQQQQPARLVQQHKPYAQGFQSSFAPQYPMSGAAMDSFPSIQEAPVGHLPPTEAFDESAFEAAFEQARADLASQTADKAQGQTQDVAEGEAQLDAVATPQTPESIKIGSDTIPQNNKDNMRAQLNDADDLAKTAGQLLESVSHDQSQKFRESNFLALMRRIRDREVHIEGDEFCEVSTSP